MHKRSSIACRQQQRLIQHKKSTKTWFQEVWFGENDTLRWVAWCPFINESLATLFCLLLDRDDDQVFGEILMMRSLLLWEMTGLWFFGIHFLASNATCAASRGIEHNRASPPLSRWWRMEKTIIESNKYFQFIIFSMIFFSILKAKKKNYGTGVDDFDNRFKKLLLWGSKVSVIRCSYLLQVLKLKKHCHERILPKNLGKKPFPWLAELKDPLLIFNQTTFHLLRYHLSKSNIPSNNDWKLVHRVRTFSGKLIILSYRLSKQR